MKLHEYWPPFLQEIADFRELATSEQPEIDSLKAAVSATPNDFFLATLNTEGVRRWEKLLGIVPQSGASLEERRQLIQNRYADQLPITFRYLQRWLWNIDPGIAASVVFYLYMLKITVPQGFGMINEVAAQLREMVPANMEIVLGANTPMEVHAGAALGYIYSHLRIGGNA